jgi:hypothetical protein
VAVAHSRMSSGEKQSVSDAVPLRGRSSWSIRAHRCPWSRWVGHR